MMCGAAIKGKMLKTGQENNVLTCSIYLMIVVNVR